MSDDRKLREAYARFPETFKLRAFPNDTFRLSLLSSYVNDAGEAVLVVQRYTDGKFTDFGKGTEAELRAQILETPAPVDPTGDDLATLVRELFDLEVELEPLAGGWGNLQLKGAARRGRIRTLRARRLEVREKIEKLVGWKMKP